jgi:membrane-associated phospholipid phosphatase
MSLIALRYLSHLGPGAVVGPISVAVAYLALIRLTATGRPRWRYWLRELSPIPVIVYIYLHIGALVLVDQPPIRDRLLASIDRALLGPELQSALVNLSLPAWGADLLTLAYASFYFIPLTVVIALAWRRDPNLPRVTAVLVFTFLVSYAGYFAVPAYGPRAGIASERYATLPDGLIGGAIRTHLDRWETTKSDVFPSGHTMVTLAALACARRRLRALYRTLLPLAALLVASTMLLSYHYVIDVIAAVPLTVVAWYAARLASGPIQRAEG